MRCNQSATDCLHLGPLGLFAIADAQIDAWGRCWGSSQSLLDIRFCIAAAATLACGTAALWPVNCRVIHLRHCRGQSRRCPTANIPDLVDRGCLAEPDGRRGVRDNIFQTSAIRGSIRRTDYANGYRADNGIHQSTP